MADAQHLLPATWATGAGEEDDQDDQRGSHHHDHDDLAEPPFRLQQMLRADVLESKDELVLQYVPLVRAAIPATLVLITWITWVLGHDAHAGFFLFLLSVAALPLLRQERVIVSKTRASIHAERLALFHLGWGQWWFDAPMSDVISFEFDSLGRLFCRVHSNFSVNMATQWEPPTARRAVAQLRLRISPRIPTDLSVSPQSASSPSVRPPHTRAQAHHHDRIMLVSLGALTAMPAGRRARLMSFLAKAAADAAVRAAEQPQYSPALTEDAQAEDPAKVAEIIRQGDVDMLLATPDRRT